MSQVTKNIRQALGNCGFETAAWHAGQAAGRYRENQSPSVDKVLGALDLLTIAQNCLVTGMPLEEAGKCGPYGSPAQRRAWAAGKLSAACYAILMAEKLAENQGRVSARIATLERKLDYARAETRAAARFKEIVVPFREPKPSARVDWLVEH